MVDMAIAVYNSAPGGSKTLPANTVEKVAGIQLNTGNNISPFWTVFGKVVVTNASANPINVVAQLVVVSPSTVLDTSMATIPGNGSESIFLEGVPSSPAGAILPMCVEINCESSMPANAEFARLIAISVDPASVVTC
jgi:hypothetical protein